jgi:hypothetical protein
MVDIDAGANQELAQTVSMEENPAELAVQDSKGQPISGVAVLGDGFSLRNTAAGTFLLHGVPPGAHLILRARGFVPACILAERSGVSRVTLLEGRSKTFTVSDTLDRVPEGTISGLPGSNCSIPLSSFESSAPPGGKTVFVKNFPSVTSATWEYDGRLYQLAIPSTGSISLPVRAR